MKFSKKIEADGTINKDKARLMLKYYKQKEGIN